MTHSKPIRRLSLLLWSTMLMCGPMLARAQAPATAEASLPVPPLSAAPKDDGQWPMAAKNYAATRYSELDQVNGNTVKNLSVAFSFSTGVNRGEEAAPLIVDNTMYIVTAYPNILYALDLTKPGGAAQMGLSAAPRSIRAGCGMLRRGQPRRRLFQREAVFQHA